MLKKILLLLLFLASITQVQSTHIKGGWISVEKIGNSGLYYVDVYGIRDVEGSVPFGEGGFIDFGDGHVMKVEPYNQEIVALNSNTELVRLSFTHTYSSIGIKLISYTEENRNANIINMYESVLTPFHIETQIFIDPLVSSKSNVQIRNLPLYDAKIGDRWSYTPMAIDPDGNRLSYQLATPKSARQQVVSGYKIPSDPEFYKSYISGNSSQDGVPIFTIDSKTGTLIWDAPGTEGTFSTAIRITEWQTIDGTDTQIGHTILDFQITVTDPEETNTLDFDLPDHSCFELGQEAIAEIMVNCELNEPGELRMELITDDTSLSVLSHDITPTDDGYALYVNASDLVKLQWTMKDAITAIKPLFVKLENNSVPFSYMSDGFLYGFGCDEQDFILSTYTASAVNTDPIDFYVYDRHLFIDAPHQLNIDQYVIYSLSGRNIKTGDASYEDSIDLSDLNDGIYIINVQAEGKVYTKRVVLQ